MIACVDAAVYGVLFIIAFQLIANRRKTRNTQILAIKTSPTVCEKISENHNSLVCKQPLRPAWMLNSHPMCRARFGQYHCRPCTRETGSVGVYTCKYIV